MPARRAGTRYWTRCMRAAPRRRQPPMNRTRINNRARHMKAENNVPYRVDVPVRWGDMDSLAHVNNARFFTYDEDVRLGFFSKLMADDARFWTDYGLILAHIGCDFLAQVQGPCELDVHYGIERIGGKSFTTRGVMHADGRPVARTRAIVVWFDYREQATLAIPDGVRARLQPYVWPDAAQ